MRIIAGTLRGRKLITPKDQTIRPTSDKIRGALFNALESRGAIRGAIVLDVFCGTGALGLEALSRGAKCVHFIDIDPALAKANVSHLGLEGHQTQFSRREATKLGQRPENMDPAQLVFLDPPYNQNLLGAALETLHTHNWLEKGTICVCEVRKMFSGDLPAEFTLDNERIYGDTKILYLTYTN